MFSLEYKLSINMILLYRNTPTIAPINEVDITTSTLNDLVQNMNDITNREKELQRQQVFIIFKNITR
jgi:hypothetical protein